MISVSILVFYLVIRFESQIPIQVFDRADLAFEDLGSQVEVRTTPMSRFFKMKGKIVVKTDIVKLQKAGCISLFTKSDNAIDITLLPRNRDLVFDVAKTIFKGAQYVDIDMES